MTASAKSFIAALTHKPALVEVADELVEAVFLLQRANSLDAIGGVAEGSDLLVHVGEAHTAQALPDLVAKRLNVCGVLCLRQRRLDGHMEETHQARLALLSRSLTTCRDVQGKCQCGVSVVAGGKAIAIDSEARLQLVRRVDQRRSEKRQPPFGGERKRVWLLAAIRTGGCGVCTGRGTSARSRA